MPDVPILSAQTGLTAGRIVPTNAEPVEGAYTLVFGDESAQEKVLSGGDYIEAVQRVTTPPTTRLIRLGALIRSVARPTAKTWRLSVLRDNVERIAITLPDENGASRSLSDIALPTDPAGETFDLSLRLTLAGSAAEVFALVPAVYLDALIDDETTAGPILINRNPEPNEINVAAAPTIAVEVHSPSADTIDLGSLTVYFDDVLILDQGSWPDIIGTLTQLDGDRTVRITFQTFFAFGDLESESTHTITVYGAVTGDPMADLLGAYSFTVEDTIVPTVLSAAAADHMRVRVTFSEPVLAVDPDGEFDVLNLDRWNIQLLSTTLDNGLPAVPITVTAIEPVIGSPAVFDLIVDWDMTPRALYRVTVGSVADLAGNAMEGGNADFAGYACPWPERRRFALFDMLPELNTREDSAAYGGTRDLEKLIKCWQEIFDLIICDIDRWTEIFDVDLAPEAFVDAMLLDLGNPFTFTLSDTEKRKLVRALVAMYQKKGTADGIIQIVQFFLGLNVEVIVPWYQGGWILNQSYLDGNTTLLSDDRALRYSFYVTCADALTDEQIEAITQIALYIKCAHEHLIGVFGMTEPEAVDHWSLNLSQLNVNTLLHA